MAESVNTDILIIGAGPAGLSTAISAANELRNRGIKKKIMVIEKGKSIGSHILSGAVIKPDTLKNLLSEEEFNNIPFDSKVEVDTVMKLEDDGSVKKLPFHPPYMSNEGNYIASLGEICRYLAKLAENRGVEIYTGFGADELIYEDCKVVGVKMKDTGVDHHGNPMENFVEGTIVKANITILAEGTRGSLAKKVINKLRLDKNSKPQIYSLGVKELWSVQEGKIEPGTVYHTFGYPLKDGVEFGGGFIYGLTNNRVALGLVVGLDYEDPTTDIHALMQIWKTHPEVKKIIEGGKILEFGAKTLPEGGWNSIPKCYDDNLLIVGDSAGFLTTARLKGIHLAVESGIGAGKAAVEAIMLNDTSSNTLKKYDDFVKNGYIYEELYPIRNFRAVMKRGMMFGGFQMGIQLLTQGACAFVPELEPDSEVTKPLNEIENKFQDRFKEKLEFDGVLTFDKVTDVYYSKTEHEEMQLCHLRVNTECLNRFNINEYGASCVYFCPAEVYEVHTDKDGKKELRIHFENCVHCKTCDIKAVNGAITWSVPYGGDGPDYSYM